MSARMHPSVVWIGSTQTQLGEVWVAVSAVGLAAVEIDTTHAAFVDQLKQRGSVEIIMDSQRTARFGLISQVSAGVLIYPLIGPF